MELAVLPLPSVLPDLAILRFCFIEAPGVAFQVGDLRRKQMVCRILCAQLLHVADGLVIFVFAAEKQRKKDLGIDRRLGLTFRDLSQVSETPVFRSIEPSKR